MGENAEAKNFINSLRNSNPDQRRSALPSSTPAKDLGNLRADQFHPCMCPCGCQKDSPIKVGRVNSNAARTKLRCQDCAQPEHASQNRPVQAPAAPSAIALLREKGSRTGSEVQMRSTRNAASDDLEAEWDRQAAEDARRKAREERKAKWLSELPSRFQRPIDDGLEPAVKERLRRLQSPNGAHQTSLLCYGPYGAGKSWVGYSYMRTAVTHDLLWPGEVTYGTESSIFEPIFLSSKWEQEDKQKALLNDKRTRMLFIDDVGMCKRWPDEQTRHTLYAEVVNWAWERERALIITTNLDLGEQGALAAWIGERAYARLRTMVGADIVFRGQDVRWEYQRKWEAEYQQAIAQERMS